MKFVGSIGAAIAAAMLLLAQPAAAKCADNGTCASHRVLKTHHTHKMTKARRAKHVAHRSAKIRYAAKHRAGKRYAGKIRITPASFTFHIRNSKRGKLLLPKHFDVDASRTPASRAPVVAMITSMAPSYGVPTWFALRIAKVESNYNPSLRGRAGEYGVFQIKCQTARGLGFSGGCSQLADARTNVRWGLKHLATALELSGGNLRLAASKHNGGLGRKTMIRGYVARIF
jgi:soluble lytic murein transglycosylase-like protein